MPSLAKSHSSCSTAAAFWPTASTRARHLKAHKTSRIDIEADSFEVIAREWFSKSAIYHSPQSAIFS
jgi:hypothetical protein